jgi:hypothetical protein
MNDTHESKSIIIERALVVLHQTVTEQAAQQPSLEQRKEKWDQEIAVIAARYRQRLENCFQIWLMLKKLGFTKCYNSSFHSTHLGDQQGYFIINKQMCEFNDVVVVRVQNTISPNKPLHYFKITVPIKYIDLYENNVEYIIRNVVADIEASAISLINEYFDARKKYEEAFK